MLPILGLWLHPGPPSTVLYLPPVQPGISSLVISTSEVCNIKASPSTDKLYCPSFSNLQYLILVKLAQAMLKLFSSLVPAFYPRATKFGLIFLLIKVLSGFRYSISFTFTSAFIRSSTFCNCSFIEAFNTGIKTFCKG